MSQETAFVDPRSKIDHPLDAGQVYTDSRTDTTLTLVFLSDDAALLQDQASGGHQLETRTQFEENVGSDRYKLQGDGDDAVSSSAQKIRSLRDRYDEQDGRTAAHKVEALDEALELIENNGQPDDHETVDFESVPGIGTAGARALRSNGFRTKGDVRDASRETIESVPNMGQKNTSNLLEHV
jgi:hypothetical protein